ncbi:MAG: sensor histidine kinase [Parapedobacter sp.]|nr:MAG: sensor histidine kinase [Parapedobacter sp.]
MDFSHEFEQKEQQLAYTELAYKNKLNFVFLVVSIIALVLVLAIVYLIYINGKRSKQHIIGLNALNEQINQRNRKLQLALMALQESHRENTRIIAMVAHDLKNPFTAIKMGIDYLIHVQQRGKSLPKSNFLQTMRKSSDRVLALIEELVDSYDNQGSANSPQEMDLSMMLRDCVDVMRLRAEKKEQRIFFSAESVTLVGHSDKIWRVMSNLIDNAIKFTPRGGRLHVRLSLNADEAIIEVSDSGIGIDPEWQEKLFEMGRTAGRKGTDGEPSTGLGLAIVKQIVSAHNGRIYFKSTPQSGTTFYVHLPLDL